MTKPNHNRRKLDYHPLLRGGAALLIASQVVEACTGTPVLAISPIVAIGVVFASLFVIMEIIEVLDGGASFARRIARKLARIRRRQHPNRKPPLIVVKKHN